MIFENHKIYDTIKFIALLILPIGTFVSTFCDIWGIPFGTQLMQTFAALDVLFGAFVTISAKAYKDKMAGDADA